MVKVSPGNDPERVALLFSPGRRLGWVFEDPWQTFRPYPQPEPVPEPEPDPGQRQQLEGKVKQAREDLVGFGVLAGIVLGCATGLVACLWGVIVHDDIHRGAGLGNSLWLAFLVFLGMPGLAAVLGWLDIRGTRADVAKFDRRRDDVRARNAKAQAAWDEDRRQYETRERDRIQGLAQWRAIELPPTIRHLAVFGGTHWGWEGLITVYGASVLGTGTPLTVLDLSRASVTEDLNRLARQHHHDTRMHCLPDDLPRLNPFAGMDAEQVVDILVDLINRYLSVNFSEFMIGSRPSPGGVDPGGS